MITLGRARPDPLRVWTKVGVAPSVGLLFLALVSSACESTGLGDMAPGKRPRKAGRQQGQNVLGKQFPFLATAWANHE